MSDMTCPTVMIETPNGPMTINESDYDPNVHKKWRAPDAPKLGRPPKDKPEFVKAAEAAEAASSAAAAAVAGVKL